VLPEGRVPQQLASPQHHARHRVRVRNAALRLLGDGVVVEIVEVVEDVVVQHNYNYKSVYTFIIT
jgi:hypothetical protein